MNRSGPANHGGAGLWPMPRTLPATAKRVASTELRSGNAGAPVAAGVMALLPGAHIGFRSPSVKPATAMTLNFSIDDRFQASPPLCGNNNTNAGYVIAVDSIVPR